MNRAEGGTSMQRMAVFVALTVAVGMVLGTVGSPVLNAEPQKRGRTTVERAIRDTDIAFSKAGAAKDLERFLAFYAQDASVFPPNLPLATGKEAIRTFFSQLWANRPAHKTTRCQSGSLFSGEWHDPRR